MLAAFRRIGEVTFELARDFRGDMLVPLRVVGDADLLAQAMRDRGLEQLVNAAALPGAARFVAGLPDLRQGYGFPVGGVAATALPDGAIAPAAVGFDINCGVRLLASRLHVADLGPPEALVGALARAVPAGPAPSARSPLSRGELDHILAGGADYLVHGRARGPAEDLDFIESRGALADADPGLVSPRAKEWGREQLGTLGGAGHFLELEAVETLFDEHAARALGLFAGQLTLLLHTGSRGLGHQVCSDHLHAIEREMARHHFSQADRQLAWAPLSSRAGQRFFAAMCAAANYAWANRQAVTARVREVIDAELGAARDARLSVVCDVAHGMARLERWQGQTLCVHRRGAVRAPGPQSDELPERYRGVGQPVVILGGLGAGSFVMAGEDAAQEVSLGSACHAVGPAAVAAADVERVADVVARAGIARKVARLRPLGVVKG